MAVTIGVYDSGIGGLTTLALLRRALPRFDFYYLADNAAMPFGTKKRDEIYRAVNAGVKRLGENSDLRVIACNTASVTVDPEGAFKLRPQLSGLDPRRTLVMATPMTLTMLNAEGFMTADTRELAVLVEIQASLSFKSRRSPDMAALESYLREKLKQKTGVRQVVLGCSHYIYVEEVLRSILGDVAFIDGNRNLCAAVCESLGESFEPKPADPLQKTKLEFTGGNEAKKYEWLLQTLEKRLFS